MTAAPIFLLLLLADEQITRVVVEKAERKLSLMSGAKTVRQYKVALGGAPVGAKERQGDHKTPEGTYTIDWKTKKSSYHWALHVSYPNAEDRARAKRLHVNPGGAIMIHGLPRKFSHLGAAHRAYDWTEGCVAVTDPEIEEIYKLVAVGTVVEIRP